MLEIDNPVSLIAISLIVFIPLIIAILYLIKPSWAYKTTEHDKQVFAWDIIIGVSVATSLTLSIMVILFFASKKPAPTAPNYFE